MDLTFIGVCFGNLYFIKDLSTLSIVNLFALNSLLYSLQFSSVQSLSCVLLFATPWMVAHQAPLLMGFSRQEYWSGLPFPTPGDLPNPVIKPASPALHADSLPSKPLGKFLVH